MVIDLLAVAALVLAVVGALVVRTVRKKLSAPPAPDWSRFDRDMTARQRELHRELIAMREPPLPALDDHETAKLGTCPKCTTEQYIPTTDYVCAGCRALMKK